MCKLTVKFVCSRIRRAVALALHGSEKGRQTGCPYTESDVYRLPFVSIPQQR